MESKLALLLPLISLIYLLQTLFRKKLKSYYKLPLTVLSIALLVFDIFVFLVFTVNCMEHGANYSEAKCIGWVYPTLDFKVMVVVSLLLLALAFIGLARAWKKNLYYAFGSFVLYLGVLFRVILLISASEAISISRGSSNPIVFEIFSIVVVYGLISAGIYFTIFFLGLFRARL